MDDTYVSYDQSQQPLTVKNHNNLYKLNGYRMLWETIAH